MHNDPQLGILRLKYSAKLSQIALRYSQLGKMLYTLLPSFVALTACASALAVPANVGSSGTLQTSIGNSRPDHEEYDLEPSASFAFAGITTFARLPSKQCLTETGPVDDILILGFPFDTATSFRTGTRLGPNAVRQGSRAASLACVFPVFLRFSQGRRSKIEQLTANNI